MIFTFDRSFLMKSISYFKRGLRGERSQTYRYMLSTQQESIWYHFHSVFSMTWSRSNQRPDHDVHVLVCCLVADHDVHDLVCCLVADHDVHVLVCCPVVDHDIHVFVCCLVANHDVHVLVCCLVADHGVHVLVCCLVAIMVSMF